MYTTSSPKRGGGVFSSMQLVSIIRPLKTFWNIYDTAKAHVHSYKSTNDRQYCSWSSCVVSLHRREELPLQLEGHNIHDAFAVVILKNSNTVGHEPRNISWYFLRKSSSKMTCTVGVNGDYSICMRDDLQSCARVSRLNIPEDAHQGGVITSQTTLCRNLGEKEGEGVFSKGAY